MTQSFLQLADGTRIRLDEKGYLLEPGQWTEEAGRLMAAADGLELGDDHWVVLRIFRDYFARFEIDPPMRALVKETLQRLGEEKGNSRYLYRLFPKGPATQACRYAGLPRPVSCI